MENPALKFEFLYLHVGLFLLYYGRLRGTVKGRVKRTETRLFLQGRMIWRDPGGEVVKKEFRQ